MARSSRFRALAAVVVLAAGCAGGPLKGPYLLHPVPPAGEPYALSQGALVFTGKDFTAAARPWDWRLVEEELRRGGLANPFGEKEGDAGRFLFFRVRLENRSAQALVFNPLRASLIAPEEAPVLPLENSDLYAFAGEEQGRAEAAGRAFRQLCYDGMTRVPPGGSVERYLVFRAPGEAKLLTLELDDLWLGSTAYAPRFVFEAFPGK